ncbi:MAG: DNA gyrase inhibitor YacG [Nitrospirota bacterium]
MKLCCPVCKRTTTWEENPWRPFCSERCKLVDLGKWAAEEYKVPGEPSRDEENERSGEDREAGETRNT